MDQLNIIFIGHVDAGKSTIGGHIMYLMGMVSDRTLKKYQEAAKALNRESWFYSWALDTNDEERAKGKTVDVGRSSFTTKSKHITILDAPGHKSFVPNMINGAAQADVAILVISARKGEFETGFERGGQTQEHVMLVKTAGINRLIVLVNKMDDPTVQWDETRYQDIIHKLNPYLRKCGFNKSIFFPVSGLGGTNLFTSNKTVCPWYDGETFIHHLDSLPPIERNVESFCLIVSERIKDRGMVVSGKVESGTISKNKMVTIMPQNIQVEVLQVLDDDHEISTKLVVPGEHIKLRLKTEHDIGLGDVLCDNPCSTGKIFDAQVAIVESKSIICPGYTPVIHLHSCTRDVTLTHLICTIDKKSGEKGPLPRFLKQDQSAIVRLELMGSEVCMETYKNFSQLGRFTLRDEGRTVALGKILKVIK